MASYPAALKTYTNKTNKVDLYDAAHMNSVQEEVVAIQTELGTDPAGSVTDVKTRLAVSIGDDGAIKQGTSFPGSPIQGQIFWRSDESTLYIRAAASWQALGQNLSNVIFCWNGADAANSIAGTSATDTSTTGTFRFHRVIANSLITILTSKFKKIAGISTITILGKIYGNVADVVNLKVDIGGVNNTVTCSSATPDWATSANIDVSGLTNGTVYDITIQLQAAGASYAFCSAVVLLAS